MKEYRIVSSIPKEVMWRVYVAQVKDWAGWQTLPGTLSATHEGCKSAFMRLYGPHDEAEQVEECISL